MKNIQLLLLVFILVTTPIIAQTTNDSINIEKKTYIYKGDKLTMKDLAEVVKSNPEAHSEIKIARSNATGANVFSYIGGFMIGWPLGTAIGGGDPNWTIAGIGIGLALVSIPFSLKSVKHTRNAVDIYNRDLNKTGRVKKTEYHLHFTGNNLGIRFLF